MDWAKVTARREEKNLSFGFGRPYIRGLTIVVEDDGPQLTSFAISVLQICAHMVQHFQKHDWDHKQSNYIETQAPQNYIRNQNSYKQNIFCQRDNIN